MIKDEKRREKAFREAKHSMELEGFVFTEEDEKEIMAVLSGEMSLEEMIEKLKRGE